MFVIADAPSLPLPPNARHASAPHLLVPHNAENPFAVSRRGRFGVCGSDFLQFEQLCQKVLLLYPSIKNAGCSRHQVSALSNYPTASESMGWILGEMGMTGRRIDVPRRME